MDVNAAIECVFIARFSPLKPENAGHDRITSGSVRFENLAGGNSGTKHLPKGLPHTDLHSNKEFTQRCGITTQSVANPESGCGDGIDSLLFTISFQEQRLILHTDDDLMMRIPFGIKRGKKQE